MPRLLIIAYKANEHPVHRNEIFYFTQSQLNRWPKIGIQDLQMKLTSRIFACLNFKLRMKAWPRDRAPGDHRDGFGFFAFGQ